MNAQPLNNSSGRAGNGLVGLQRRTRRKALSWFLALALLIPSAAGCKENPAKWPPERIASHIEASLQTEGLTLAPSATGYEGSGKTADGETLTVVVALHPESSKISWTVKGDRGYDGDGSYQLD